MQSVMPSTTGNSDVKKRRRFSPVIALLTLIPVIASLVVTTVLIQHHTPAAKASSANAVPLGAEFGFEWVDLVKQGARFQKISGAATDITYDTNGWPQNDFEYILVDDRRNKPWDGPDFNGVTHDASGTYHLSFTGQATLAIGTDVDAPDSLSIQNASYNASTNTTTADVVVPKNRWLLSINFTQTKRQPGDTAGNGLTNVRMIRPGYPANTTQVFTDRSINALQALHPATLRTFDTGTTGYNIFNGSNYVAPNWSDRSLPTDAYWNLPSKNTGTVRGFEVPWEYVIQMSNQIHADPWINLPITADDSYITSLATLFKNGDTVGGVTYPGLDSSLHLYIELGNENWNPQFTQTWYTNGQAQSAGISPLQWEVQRTYQMANDFAGVFGAGSLPNTIRPVVLWQYGHALDVQSALLWGESQFKQSAKNTMYGIGEAPYVNPTEPTYTDGGSEKENGRATMPDPADPNAVNNIMDTFYTSAGQRRLSFIAWQTAANFLGVHQVGYESGPSLNAGIEADVTRSPRMNDFIQRYYQENYFAIGGDAVNFFAVGQGYPNDNGDWYTFEDYNNLNYGKYQGLLNLQGQARPALSDGFLLPWSVNSSVAIDPSQHITGDNNLRTPGSTACIGWNCDASEDYLLRVPASGTYAIKLNGQASNASASVQILVDDSALGTVQLPQNAAGDSSSFSITLSPGLHTLELSTNAPAPANGSTTLSTAGIVVTLSSGGGSATAPSAPINVLSTVSDSKVSLNWENVTTATSYSIKRSTTSGGPYAQVGTSNSNSFTDTGVTNGTTYYYVVSAINAGGESALSPQYRIVPTPATAPAQPTGVVGQAGGADTPFMPGGQVRISWPSVPNAVTYNIKRSSSVSGPFTKIHSQYDNIYHDDGLTLGTTYYYVISAVNTNGESSDSSVVALTPQESAPATPSGLTAAGNAGSVSLSWQPVQWQLPAFADLYNIKRGTSSNGPFTTVWSQSVDNGIDYNVTGGTQYCYVVSAVNSKGESVNSQPACATPSTGTATPTPTPGTTPTAGVTPTPGTTPTTGVTPTPSPTPTQGGLPSPWQNQDIGSVGLAGSSSYTNGTFTVAGSGADIWGGNDAFQYAYQSLSGDGSIVARVVSLTNTDGWAKAGVMIRETLTAGSTQAMTAVTGNEPTVFQRRTSTDGSSTNSSGPVHTAPYWVKLVRSGNTFTSSVSSDGTNWTQVGSDTISMATNVYIGLAVTAHNNSALNTSTFDNVTVTGSIGIPPTPTPTPTPTPNWTQCASEGGTCTFSGTQNVRYGANGQYVYQTAIGSIPCTNAAFGSDPDYGVVKACYIAS